MAQQRLKQRFHAHTVRKRRRQKKTNEREQPTELWTGLVRAGREAGLGMKAGKQTDRQTAIQADTHTHKLRERERVSEKKGATMKKNKDGHSQ